MEVQANLNRDFHGQERPRANIQASGGSPPTQTRAPRSMSTPVNTPTETPTKPDTKPATKPDRRDAPQRGVPKPTTPQRDPDKDPGGIPCPPSECPHPR